MALSVTLPDGTELELPDGATGADAAAAIGPGLAKAALAIEVTEPGGQPELRDLARPLPGGARISILTERSGEAALELIRHDAAHVLATAVLELYDGVKISIGPPIEDGFYYDFEFPEGTAISEADFPAIEARMREHVKAAEPFVREDVPVGEARDLFLAERQDYKVELIDDLLAASETGAAGGHPTLQTVSLYKNGPFTDLCRGPHAPTTGTVKAFKLNSVAGAYWRGDSTRTMLTRIYGTAFFSKAALEEHLERIEQARARDHRKLGPELGLFRFSEVSPGAAFWLPAGTGVFNTLVALSRRMGAERGYSEVKTPLIFDAELWKTSGHWEKYRDDMFTLSVEGREMAIKPMNCPGHCQLYSMTRHSYRDLPLRYFEPGLLHRNEASGVLHGLLRVRHFAQDDGHIFCTEEQVQDEVRGCLEMAFATYALFDFDMRLELSTRPENRIGDDELWDRAELKLSQALDELGLEYDLNPGDGAFYGPKIDVHMTDSLGRSWQTGTVQLDYSMPERFGLTYTGADNAEHTPVMIHRAMFGSYERFIGILIEHYAGELPLWLVPLQVIVLPVSDRFNEYAEQVAAELREAELRLEVDERSESVGRKIREAELRKVPYMLVVGEREQESQTVSVRSHADGDAGASSVSEFAEEVRGQLYSAALTPRKTSQRQS
ncbi:MAG TPA: threonine--tRNA ligase [Solirubrobacteraceae bacterium]|nr:threonine--tRNA ligase [Solirubrobacteraceae bacterium]